VAEADDPEHVFDVDDREDYSSVVPTRFAQGPWDPNSQHGGACMMIMNLQ